MVKRKVILTLVTLPCLLLAGVTARQHSTISHLRESISRIEPQTLAFAIAWDKYLREPEGSEAAVFHLKVACGHARQIRLDLEFSKNPRALYEEIMESFNKDTGATSLASLCTSLGPE